MKARGRIIGHGSGNQIDLTAAEISSFDNS